MIDININDLHEKCLVQGRVIRPGDHIFVFCVEGREWKKSFYVKALVDEVQYIWSCDALDASIWHGVRIEGTEIATTETKEMDENGWPFHREVSPEELEHLRQTQGLKVVNQMPWVDWPIGHAAYIGDEGFLTLEDARARYGRFPKRNMKRRMRSHLRKMTGFIASTWKHGGHGDHPGFPPIDSWMRKGYV